MKSETYRQHAASEYSNLVRGLKTFILRSNESFEQRNDKISLISAVLRKD